MNSRFILIASAFSPLIGHAEQMPWETSGYKAQEFKATSSYLGGIPMEDLVLFGTISKPGAPAEALIQIRGARVLRVQVGMRIGLNEGVVKEFSEGSLTVQERLPVCGGSEFYTRATKLNLNQPLPSGTTVAYTVSGGVNVCE